MEGEGDWPPRQWARLAKDKSGLMAQVGAGGGAHQKQRREAL